MAEREGYARRQPRLTDEFLIEIANRYRACVKAREYPAPIIAKQVNKSPRTVHGWINEARRRGHLEPSLGKGAVFAPPELPPMPQATRRPNHATVLQHLADQLVEAENHAGGAMFAWELVRKVEFSLRVLAMEVED